MTTASTTSWTNWNWKWMTTASTTSKRLRSPWTWWLDTDEWVAKAGYMLGVKPWYLTASIRTVRSHDWLSSAYSAWYLSPILIYSEILRWKIRLIYNEILRWKIRLIYSEILRWKIRLYIVKYCVERYAWYIVKYCVERYAWYRVGIYAW
jgi:hypothetical protein